MANDIETLGLLRTKLYRPRLAGDLVHRARVHEVLNRHADRPATLVCAPAGFGKTTLLSDWLEHSRAPSAWLALDERDSNLGTFLSYFVAAVRTHFPAACAETLRLLRAPVLLSPDQLVTTLANDLDHLQDDPALPAGQRFVLVLDDCHLVREPAVHAVLSELLRHPPQTLHLVLSARQDPPFPLRALRARGELVEIRVRELRFTLEEAAAFMERALETPLKPGELATLVERTEGWWTGLRLAALTLNAGSDLAGPDLALDDRYAQDYLMNEVLAHIPVATQNFLLATSVLDRLCGPLCDAVAPPGDSAWDGRAYLEWLAAENVFTFSLDAHGTWYRYHQLFQRMLVKRLERQRGPQEVVELHRRASAWLAQNGLIDEAIWHAQAADDPAMVQLLGGRREETRPVHPARLPVVFGDVQNREPVRSHSSQGKAPPRASELIEPLSERELDVLGLLGDRLSSKEIARELCISPSTVKRHASNIYQKLAVGNRRDAVARASTLGLLPAPPPVRPRFTYRS